MSEFDVLCREWRSFITDMIATTAQIRKNSIGLLS